MTTTSSIAATAITEAADTFRSQKDLADRAIIQLRDEQLHVTLHPETNCVAVIMKHLTGNMLSRWTDLLTTDGEKPWRDRDDEFIDSFADRPRKDLLDQWERGWHCLFHALCLLQGDDLTRIIHIRGEPHTVVKAIDRQIAHCGYHVGQIVLIARTLAGANWNTLTIPRGESRQFNERMAARWRRDDKS
jgi:hypothetical protein